MVPQPVRSRILERVTELTLLTPIKQGFVAPIEWEGPRVRYVDRLRRSLAAFEGLTRPHGLDQIATIHFARWAIVDSERTLLFASSFDGSWDKYLRDFAQVVPDLLDGVWANCEGYPGARRYEEFIEWVRSHQVRVDLFYASFPDLTVRDIKYLKDFKAEYDRFESALERCDRSSWPDDLRRAFDQMDAGVRAIDLKVLP